MLEVPRRNLYALTAHGLRFAIFYTKVPTASYAR